VPEPAKSWNDIETLARNKTKVLVVDDEDAMAEIAASMLTSEGYFVETATNGDVAFDLYCQYLAEGQPFDFVLTGLAQPGMNGVELVEAILKKRPARTLDLRPLMRCCPAPSRSLNCSLLCGKDSDPPFA